MILAKCRPGSPFFFFFIVNAEVKLPRNALSKLKSSDGLAKKLRLWSLLKFKILLRLLKKSPFEGERPWEKSYPSVAFSMVSRSLSQLGEIFNWRVWWFTYQDTQRHCKILGEREEFSRKTRRWEKVFSKEDLKEPPRLPEGKRRSFS